MTPPDLKQGFGVLERGHLAWLFLAGAALFLFFGTKSWQSGHAWPAQIKERHLYNIVDRQTIIAVVMDDCNFANLEDEMQSAHS